MLTHIPIALAGHDEFLDSIGLWFGKGVGTIKRFITGVTGSTFSSPMVAPVPVWIHPNTAPTPVFWTSFAPKSVFCVAIFVAANKKTPFRIVIEEQVNRCKYIRWRRLLQEFQCFLQKFREEKVWKHRSIDGVYFYIYYLSLPSVRCFPHFQKFRNIADDIRIVEEFRLAIVIKLKAKTCKGHDNVVSLSAGRDAYIEKQNYEN